jgi:solute:Na+ symporter, SSS family
MNMGLLAVIIILYLATLSYLAYLGYRQTQSAEDYLVAGRSIHPGIMALSYGATFISTSAIVGFGGAAGVFGFGLLWLTFLNIFLGIIIAFAVFGIRIRKLGVSLGSSTFPELLGKRYKSRFITFFSGLMIFIFMPAYTSIILIGGARFMEETLYMDYNVALFVLAIIIGAYVVTGGLKAVMYTDALCAGIMFIGMAILLFSAYSAVGGIVAGHAGLSAIKDMVPDGMVAAGHRGWTSMPESGSPYWWTMVSTIVMGVGIGVLAQPQLTMRFMTVQKTSSLYRAITVGSIFIFFMTGTAFMVGPLSNLFFANTRDMISITVAGGNTDLVIPAFINAIMPTWFVYIFMLALISAAVSTTSSLIHVQGAAWGRDIVQTWREWKPGPEGVDSSVTFIVRLGVLIGVILAIIVAYLMPISIVARATAFWFGICACGFLPVLIGSLYWKRATRSGAIWSIVSGYAVAIFGFVFMHIAESQPFGIAQALFGKPALFAFPWTHIDPLFYALPVSAIVFVVVSLLTSPLEKEHIDSCFHDF